jgi:prolyl-tRNA editing enzyme YbaK/EbsC (Cys-tRNA(Pro) deacylase)
VTYKWLIVFLNRRKEIRMTNALKPSAQKVQDTLIAGGFTNQIIELPDSTRTSIEAAAAVGCAVAQIAKSLIFQGKESRRAILVIASGVNRVNEKRMAELIGEKLQKPDADFVRDQTGFVIGGVPPLGHTQPLITYIDEDLLQYAELWAAAGHPNAVFKLIPAELVRMTNGTVLAIT